MVVRWDGMVPAGVTDGRIVLNVDVARTVAEAAGVPMRTDGLDILGGHQRKGFVLEAMNGYHDRPAYCGWRTKHRMYVRWATGEQELFDYRSDPNERRNLAGKQRWHAVLKKMKAKARAACSPVPPNFRWKPDRGSISAPPPPADNLSSLLRR
jgi:arylsulfatase A-like enzyme